MTTANITVTVAVDIHGNPHVTCTPSTISITQATTLQFNLTTSGWVFPTTNPVYLNNPPDANFPNAPVNVSSTVVTWDDVFASTGDIGYTARVQSATTGVILLKDPIIHNTTL